MARYIEQITNITRSIPKIKDSITLGVISGLLGTLALDVLNFRNWRKNRTESMYAHIAGSIFMRGFRTKFRKNFLFGQVIHMFVGALAGVPLVYLFRITGKDHSVLKGATYGALIWMIYYMFGIKVGMFHKSPKQNKSHMTNLMQNLIFGITSAQTVISLGDPSLFRTVSQQEQKPDGKAKMNGKAKTDAGTWTLPYYYTDFETEKAYH